MLRMPRYIGDAIIAHASEGFPLEVCGILGGNDGVVSSFFRMTNTDRSNEHFMMEPREQFAVMKELRAKGLELLAIYHSHPESPARPSTEDIRLALTPNVSHVIVSLMEPDKPVLKSFRINAGRVEPEKVDYL
jgi:proteasome lid subunit RPN8/RPN11